ncbi:MAG: type III-A CRISPR-associated protein Csm2 [Clostridiales bacterium]|nr:type III-A CRISPR-associated protein Csm2 [Clostridiales bacterium]
MAGNNYNNYNNRGGNSFGQPRGPHNSSGYGQNHGPRDGNGYGQNRGPRNGSGQGGNHFDDDRRNSRGEASKPIVAKPLPADYVDVAEKVIQTSGKQITTSKLRNLLSQFVDVYNVENLLTGERLQPASVNALTMARIRMLYEAGREPKVKNFIETAELLSYLKDIGDNRVKMLNYYHYLEALVAYHKYYGGKEN